MSFCHGYLNNKTWIGNLDFLSNCLLFSCFRLLLVLVKECEIWYIFYIFHFAYCRCIDKILLLKLDWYNFFYDFSFFWVFWTCLVVLKNLKHLMLLNLLLFEEGIFILKFRWPLMIWQKCFDPLGWISSKGSLAKGN